MSFKTILIANRGEIARRVVRSAHECGYLSAAIYSPHDRTALYVRESDFAVALRGNAPRESYLDHEQVLWAAERLGAQAIHPGYGFLSENAAFSDEASQRGITFIGPSPDAIDLLGDKTKARTLAHKLGVPTPGGTTTALKSGEEALEVARRVGYPVLLKAAAGGGGKGMRVVHQESELLNSLDRAKGEALTAFGDDRVYVEKYIINPRHIEFQILADSFGNVVHLGERECSIQRRHQKLIEESPSVIVDSRLREEMGDAAKTLIRAAKYVGAGTVEFLVDQDGKFYFLEVNTRLQVEHPVTEFVTGMDLVREQFRIAEGEALGYTQSEIEFRGHSVEVRVQAEDIWNDFLPSLGTISHVRHPGGAFVRNDSGMFAGLEVSGHYDSLLSKLIVWDRDRASAIKRMQRALLEMKVVGVSTSIPFASFVLANDRFREGTFSTAFVESEFTPEVKTALYESYINRALGGFAAAQRQVDQAKERKSFVGLPKNS